MNTFLIPYVVVVCMCIVFFLLLLAFEELEPKPMQLIILVGISLVPIMNAIFLVWGIQSTVYDLLKRKPWRDKY